MAPLQVKGLEEEAERAAEAEQATLAAMRRDAEDTQARPCPSYTNTLVPYKIMSSDAMPGRMAPPAAPANWL
jgi:hypothetical protein